MANLGVPTKLLHESLGHIITVELKTGEVSRALKCLLRLSVETDDRCTAESSWRVCLSFSVLDIADRVFPFLTTTTSLLTAIDCLRNMQLM